MKKKFLVSISIIIVLLFLVVIYNFRDNDKNILKNKEDIIFNNNNNTLAIMLETSANSGAYQSSSNNAWPTSGYEFNATLSKCENGGILTWNASNNTVSLKGNVSDKCYVYFDVIPPKSLADYIKELYTIQGANNLYHHDGTLENGINDGSYRYAGKYESVNNWVCFGYDDPTRNYANGWCPANNLYRIIGVFNEKVLNEDGTDSGKKEDRVKLIMNDYPGESVLGKAQDGTTTPYPSFTGASKPSGNQPGYAWSGSTSTNSNKWLTSTLNTNTLNGTYLTILGNEWAKRIALTEWKVGGNDYSNIRDVKAATAYQNEIVSLSKMTSDAKKVGLMYVHDYGFAASKENWTTSLGSYNNDTNRNNNWLYRGVSEWTITPHSSGSNYVFCVNSGGNPSNNGYVVSGYGVRPSFYLEASVTYASGEGTQTNPYRIG